MASVTYHLSGERELLTGPEARAFLTKLCLRVERAAKRYAPVDTGRLRASIGHKLTADTTGLLGVVGTTVHYAGYVELGTRYMRPRPYLRPALAKVASAL